MHTIHKITYSTQKEKESILFCSEENNTSNDINIYTIIEEENIVEGEVLFLEQMTICFLALPKVNKTTIEITLATPLVSLVFIYNKTKDFLHFTIVENTHPKHTFFFDTPKSHVNYLVIHITKSKVQDLLKAINSSITLPLCTKLIKASDWLLTSYFMHPKILQVVKEIIYHRKNTSFAKYFLDLKVRELFLLQLESVEEQKRTRSTISEEDYTKILLAQKIVLDNITAPLSLVNLAREVGTNDFKLKKYFKEIYGTTVFGYITTIKMLKAEEKLLYTTLPIYEIADALGYKTQTHFSTVFKKFYGYPPSEVKRNKNTLLLKQS